MTLDDYMDVRVNGHLVCRIRRDDLVITYKKSGGSAGETSLRHILEAAGYSVERIQGEPSVWVIAG